MNAQDRAAAVRQVQEDSNAFARSLVNGREPNMTYAREFVEHQVAVTKSLNKPRETDLKTVVRKLREDSETFSRSLEVLPNPNRTDASQPRKKRWAARVRTGCVTCRFVLSFLLHGILHILLSALMLSSHLSARLLRSHRRDCEAFHIN